MRGKMYKSVHTSQGVAYMGVLPGCTNIIVSNDARYRNNIKFFSQKIETRKKWQHSNQQCAVSAGTDSCRSYCILRLAGTRSFRTFSAVMVWGAQ